MDDLHLTLLATIARNARLADMDIALSWQVLQALLDEIGELKTPQVLLERAVVVAETPTPTGALSRGVVVPSDIICTCGKTFMNKRALGAHLRRAAEHAWERGRGIGNLADTPPALACPECGKDSFGTVKGFKAHMRIVHDIRE